MLVKQIDKSTQSFFNFWSEMQRSEFLISYLKVGDKLIRNNIEESKENLIAIYDNNFNTDKAKKELRMSSDRFLDINFYTNHLSALIFVHTLDNFTTYFKEILSEVVKKNPLILKSKESESLEFILDFDSMDELVKAITTKKIEKLFYKGIEDIDKFFDDRLGIKIFKNKEKKNDINFLIKQRNLVVHNRRKVSKDFIRQFPNRRLEEGKYLTYDFNYVTSINIILFNFLSELDSEISKKFKLSKIPLRQ